MPRGMNQYDNYDKEKIVEALKPYFLLGYSVNKACELAKFKRTTFQTWLADDEELRLQISAWQGQVSATARKNVVEKITGRKGGVDKDGKEVKEVEPDIELSKWWLERKDKDEFSSKDSSESGSLDVIAAILQKSYDQSRPDREQAEDNQDADSESVQER